MMNPCKRLPAVCRTRRGGAPPTAREHRMGFYQKLSQYYDEIFPASEAEAAFVRQLLTGKKRLLDIGCGNGNKTALLKTDSVESVVGIDADQGMVDAARRDHARAGLSYLTLDMLSLGSAFPPGSFDGAVCLGNTLVHLTRPGELAELLRQTHAVLQPGGVLTAQIINYDRIIEKQLNSLPVIETPNLTFLRQYQWRDGDMHFLTTLRLKNGGEYHFDTLLNPIRQAALDEVLTAAGFGGTDYYGSFAGEPYGADSYHIVFRAQV